MQTGMCLACFNFGGAAHIHLTQSGAQLFGCVKPAHFGCVLWLPFYFVFNMYLPIVKGSAHHIEQGQALMLSIFSFSFFFGCISH
jgi:hypothetical protein